MAIDPIRLTQDLIRCQSVTPQEGGAITLLDDILSKAGFICTRVDREGIANLFARWGRGKTLGFNGHIDVVPVGDVTAWSAPPFGGEIRDGLLYGRGAVDMKSGVAAFVAAAVEMVQNTPPDGSIAITITGDEEGQALDGTAAILDWMAQHNEQIDHCIVGEPTCPDYMGEAIKIGRRGSMTAYIRAHGVQGHSAYPQNAKNPIHAMNTLLHHLCSHTLDQGTAHFEPSSLAVTGFDVGNKANNVIPERAEAMVNIRFNDAHHSKDLCAWLDSVAAPISAQSGVAFDITYQISGESFITQPDDFTKIVADVVQAETGHRPALSTSGGISDARFIRAHCPVLELGLVGKTMHQVDEHTPLEHIHQLQAIYAGILRAYFK